MDDLLEKVKSLIPKVKKKKRKELCHSIEQEIEEINKKNKSLIKENQELKKKIHDLGKQKDNKKQIQKNSKGDQECFLADFEEEIKIYSSIVDKFFLCQSCEDLLSQFGINTNRGKADVKNLIRLVGMIGNGTSFAHILCSYYENRGEKLGEAETAVFDSLNQFYRDTYGLNYDVIYCPLIDGKEHKFDKQLMKDDNKRTAIFLYYEEVHAPGMMRNSNSIERMAIVVGHN